MSRLYVTSAALRSGSHLTRTLPLAGYMRAETRSSHTVCCLATSVEACIIVTFTIDQPASLRRRNPSNFPLTGLVYHLAYLAPSQNFGTTSPAVVVAPYARSPPLTTEQVRVRSPCDLSGQFLHAGSRKPQVATYSCSAMLYVTLQVYAPLKLTA